MQILKIDGRLIIHPPGFTEVLDRLISLAPRPVAILISGDPAVDFSLRNIAFSAVAKSNDFSGSLLEVEGQFLKLAREILPVQHQSKTLSFIRQQFNSIDDLCKGIQLLGEATPKTMDCIRIFPALIQSHLFHAACLQAGMSVLWTEKPNWNKEETMIIPDPGNEESPLYALLEKGMGTMTCWTKGNLFSSADPEAVSHAAPIPSLSYEEALELLPKGQNLLDVKSLAIASHQGIALKTVNFLSSPLEETIIGIHLPNNKEMVTGISSRSGINLVNMEGGGMIGVPGFAKRVFSALHDAGINVILISQGASEHSICIAMEKEDAGAATAKLNEAFYAEIDKGIIQKIKVIEDVSIIGLAGENMRNHPGISGRMFSALGRNGINVLAIAQGSSERNISAVISESDRIKSLNVLHETFFGKTSKEINLFVIGTGNVGKKLIGQIKKQQPALLSHQNLRLKVTGLINSRKMIINTEGIELEKWEDHLSNGSTADLKEFVSRMIGMNLRNAVLVDVTANEKVPQQYATLLKKSMSVVACNKIAASDRYETYSSLKALALSYNCKFLFETNVGAALPIIGTLNDLVRSGDKINSIEAVLSGTLNYVFNHYNGSKPFAEVVWDAQQEGYTEPDPRLDLSGTDVMRKIMILARESGYKLEMEDITCHSFLPDDCTKGSVENFYAAMRNHEDHFLQLLNNAKTVGAKLKFVARFEEGKASVGLQHIQSDSEMYHLYGKDNIVLFKTSRYPEQPLIVKGAGAGADVTASGVFADIMRTLNH